MKIGIITFHDALNYGAVLQTYALSNILKEITGSEVDIIDYENPEISAKWRIQRIKENRSVKGMIKRIVSVPFLERRNSQFKAFLEKNVSLSDMVYDTDNISELNHIYDVLVFGSDQIWNLILTGNDLHYYGDFVENTKAIAYAASFGKYDLRTGPESIKDLVARFDSVSVREEKDKIALKQHFGLDAYHAADPTILLRQDEWYKIEEGIDAPARYILLYLVSPAGNDFSLAHKLKAATGLPMVYINYSYRSSVGMKNIKSASPGNFLFLLHHADIVITNSFHGTALSMISNKKFYWIHSPSKGKINHRVLEILGKWGLEQCIVTEEQLPFPGDININWEQVNDRILEDRLRSLEFLRRALTVNHS